MGGGGAQHGALHQRAGGIEGYARIAAALYAWLSRRDRAAP